MELQIIIALNGLIGVLNAFYAAKNHREFTRYEALRKDLHDVLALRDVDQQLIKRLEYKVATLEQRVDQLENEKIGLLTQIARMANGKHSDLG